MLAERGRAMECFVSLGAQTNPPAGSEQRTVPTRRKARLDVPILRRFTKHASFIRHRISITPARFGGEYLVSNELLYDLPGRLGEQEGAHETVEVAVEHALRVAHLELCAVILDQLVGM